ncbi:unnamed protein product [Macrosiphum euphorbiae]|uniref:BESS domain-containing protein n=1 Tax=Macrosiphum euphorbiae TaxID=13131 RepID=A0AAV0WT82_9HEMI|nr:unnamed protein product [Macrosiphum euphorbiae]
MQFTVPFLKTSAVPSGNLPPIPSDENVETTDMWENTLLDTSEVTESSEIQNQPHSPQLETLPMPPPPTQSSIQHSSQPEQAESQKSTKKIARKKNNNSSDADEAFIEYFKSKKAKINNSPRDIRADSIQQFLNSLIPDLLTMTDAQLRTCKRRSIAIIDEILGTNLCTFSPATSVETRLQQSPAGSFLSSFSSEDETDKQHYLTL